MRSVLMSLILCAIALGGQRPNIVLLYADDHAQAAIGCYGSVLTRTPHIDSLAARGMRFTQSFVTNSICAPARAVVMTGLHSHRNGQLGNRPGLRADVPLLSELLRAGGYRTAVIGKWHLPGDPRGFDDWTVVEGPYYAPFLRTAKGKHRGQGHCTDIIAHAASDWLEEHGRQSPFFLWVCFHATHRTWDPAIRYLDLYRDRDLPEPRTLFDDHAGRNPGAALAQMRIARDLFPAYDLKLPVTGKGILDGAREGKLARLTAEEREAWDAAYGEIPPADLDVAARTRWNYQRFIKDYLRCVRGLDDAVGAIQRQLDELDLTESTLVIYTSDQGFFLGEHGWYDKRWMYEPALRTPLIAAGPGVRVGTSDLLVQNLDLAPTLLDYAGLEGGASMQGRSLTPLLRGVEPDSWRDAIYYRYYEYDEGRTFHRVTPHYGIRTARHKLIYFERSQTFELYDLERDPDEMHNLASNPEQAELRRSLERRLQELRASYGDS